jgi:ATP-dependent Clp protease ATP-binding subunit ClpX
MSTLRRATILTTPPKAPLFTQYRALSLTALLSSNYGTGGFSNHSGSFSSTYEPGQPTQGPLGGASPHGAPKLTPTLLKEHLDRYVVGQDKAKKVTSVAIYNHYQRIRELRRREEEERERREQRERWEVVERERNAHPVESESTSHDVQNSGYSWNKHAKNMLDEYPGHIETVDLNRSSASSSSPPPPPSFDLPPQTSISEDTTTIEKSNLLLLGPSGVGKTYILSTLASTLSVPFTTVDCSSLTQAGYIGTDIESSIERLLLASNHNIAKCETGIIFFDEVDKLAKPAVMTHGRDVSGEGVQQGLLKMIEGTMVTVNAKQDRSSRSEKERGERLERGQRDSGAKGEQYTIDTTNILFVFAGAFVGLEKIISSRLSSGSGIGFGATLKSSPPSTQSSTKFNSKSTSKNSSLSSPKLHSRAKSKPALPPPSMLQHVTPVDLQTYGLIPELLGRIPILTSLSPLTLEQLISILTEPRNSLVKQYTALFKTYGIDLKFTTGALYAVAEKALASPKNSQTSNEATSGGIGARGLRGILEGVLGEVMFRGPGSGIRYCLVDESFVRSQTNSGPESHAAQVSEGDGDEMPRCWSRGQGRAFEDAFENEEANWRAEMDLEAEPQRGAEDKETSFEGLRRVGSSGM